VDIYRNFSCVRSVILPVIFCISLIFSLETSHAENKDDQYLREGKHLGDLVGPNADRIRSIYNPIVERYPNLKSCISNTSETIFTRRDLQALTSINSAEVCIFYYALLVKSNNEIIRAMSILGFNHLETLRSGGRTRMRFIWNSNYGQIVNISYIDALLSRITTAGVTLELDFSETRELYNASISKVSKLQF